VAALRLDRRLVRQYALKRSWRTIAQELVAAVVPISAGLRHPASR